MCAYLLYAFHFNVENAFATFGGDRFDGLDGGAVVIAAELGMLDESVGVYEGEEFVFCNKVIVFAVLFAITRLTSCVCMVERDLVKELSRAA